MKQLYEEPVAYCEEAGVDQAFTVKLVDTPFRRYGGEPSETYDFKRGTLRVHGSTFYIENGKDYETTYDFLFYPDKIDSLKIMPIEYPGGHMKTLLMIEMYPEPHKIVFDNPREAQRLRLAINRWRVNSLYEKSY